VQFVIAAHQHKFRYDAPTADRPWAQIVGGGPNLGSYDTWSEETGLVSHPDETRFPTVVEGRVVDGVFRMRVHDVFHNKVVFEKTLA